MVATLTSVRSERVTFVRRLHDRSVRRERGLFVVEGAQGVREALAVPGAVQQLFVSQSAAAKWPDLPVDVTVTSEQVLTAMAETEHPQGILAVCRTLDVSLSSIADDARLVVILHQASDPGNAGTILRTADAFGADAVIFTKGSVDAYNGKCVRSSAGSLFHIPVVLDVELADAVSAVRERGLEVCATDGSAELMLGDSPRGTRSAWMIGTEAHGLDSAALALADRRIAIEMPGRAESLNAAVAAAIVLYHSAVSP